MENKRQLKTHNERVNQEGDTQEDKLTSAKLGFNALFRISELLDTGLDRESLMYCMRLCQNGVEPEGLAQIIIDMKKLVAPDEQQE